MFLNKIELADTARCATIGESSFKKAGSAGAMATIWPISGVLQSNDLTY